MGVFALLRAPGFRLSSFEGTPTGIISFAGDPRKRHTRMLLFSPRARVQGLGIP